MTARIHDLPRNSAAEIDDSLYADTIEALASCDEDALSKAACGGLLDPQKVRDWSDRAQRLVLYERDRSALRSEIPVLAARLAQLLEQVKLPQGVDAATVVRKSIERLPAVRDLLADDVEAAYSGDPAAASYEEIVVAYPSITALSVHRLAHELHVQGVPMLPRVLSEYAHAQTGVDIHPGAQLGRRCFLDHGTGIVIGETAVVGDRVRIYQGVTLGATSVPDADELRGHRRHPTIEDDVTIYAGATILGGDTVIGRGSVVGGNVWITESLPPGSRVMAEPARHLVRRGEEENALPMQLQWDLES